jgi:hypothetical protein
LHITLPQDIPTGPADIVLVVSSSTQSELSTLEQLADSEFFGLWRDREVDSSVLGQELRTKGWDRSA